MFTRAHFIAIVRLVAGTALAAVLSRKLSLLVERIALHVFGEFDGSLLRWGAFALFALCGFISTLYWAGIIKDEETAKKSA